MTKHIGMDYLYAARLVFVEISSGVYKIAKDRSRDYYLGEYVTEGKVVECLNNCEKVAIAKGNLDTIAHANFELGE